ncbi:MAG: glycosyltransferase family 2 protein [Acidobacteriota bacterium]|jgi:glycosyltransferase involved in cell wall biosynthesis|nr:glycosyltransferase family 2 protein [Acidobacteriota bacterium]
MADASGVSFIVPCFNEVGAIEKTIRDLYESLDSTGVPFEILVVDDGSTDGTTEILRELAMDRVSVIFHEGNQGYGAAIKSGIRRSRYDRAGIIDADGTYPAESVPELLAHITGNDMVTGIRTGDVRAVPLLRRPAKWFLNRFASYLVKKKIRDVNSGLRVFRKDVVIRAWHIFPDGFSFTTTITLLCALENLKVKTIPVDYRKRKGRSKIHPLKDTYNFFLLLMRITMLFNPLRIFMPIAITTFIFSLGSLARDIIILNLTDTTVLLFLFSVIFLMIGLLADLINKRIR